MSAIRASWRGSSPGRLHRGLLAFIGYPLPRVLALAATLTASLAMFVVWLSRSCSDCLPSVTPAQGETIRMVPRFLLMFLGIALTGGSAARSCRPS